MAKKRKLKHNLNYVCNELFAECVLSYTSVTQDDVEQVDTILKSILKIHKDFIGRVMHPEPGMKANRYYHTLREDFNKQVSEIIGNISALA